MNRTLLQRWLRDARGVAAVEFAAVAPLIAAVVVTSYGVWDIAVRQQNLRSALKVGAEYYMTGGADDAAARRATLASWENPPPNADVSVSRICRCGAVVIDCAGLCPDSEPPAIYVVLRASALEQEALFSPTAQADKVVRVR